jgi:hypothetical protein
MEWIKLPSIVIVSHPVTRILTRAECAELALNQFGVALLELSRVSEEGAEAMRRAIAEMSRRTLPERPAQN